MSALAFELPKALEAHEPPEARGIERDEVRLLVASREHGAIEHKSFSDLPDLLAPGDLLVVNVSATIPAAVPATREDGSAARIHFATRVPRLDDEWWVVELRSADGARPAKAGSGERIQLRGGATLQLVAPYVSQQRLLLARIDDDVATLDYLQTHGQPIRYGYVPKPWPLEAYQNVYATTPGSAEMPSAGRPFTERLITKLTARGIAVAPITLHAGVSSPERDEPPIPEYFEVPEETARRAKAARRVIAVGTTVVRALETALTTGNQKGWTGLVITPERGIRSVDGLITGWHEPAASHLQMLEAIAGRPLLEHSYREALEHDYLWHEFGDSHLIL